VNLPQKVIIIFDITCQLEETERPMLQQPGETGPIDFVCALSIGPAGETFRRPFFKFKNELL